MWKRRHLTSKDSGYLIIIIILFTTGSDLFSNFIFQNQISVIRNNVFRILFLALCSVFCIMYYVLYILCSVFCIPYCVYCILYSVLCDMYSVFCILFLVFCILYSVMSILYSVLCILFLYTQ